MPYTWASPATFMSESEAGGKPVFHAYCDNGTMLMDYWYQVHSDDYDTGYAEFDIRDLAGRLRLIITRPGDRELHKAIIRHGVAMYGVDIATLLKQLEIETHEGETGW